MLACFTEYAHINIRLASSGAHQSYSLKIGSDPINHIGEIHSGRRKLWVNVECMRKPFKNPEGCRDSMKELSLSQNNDSVL